MPDTGAPWNIPYAAPADLVRDWPDLSEDVADAVAAGLSAAVGLVEVKHVLKTNVFSASVASGASVDVDDLSIAHAVADAANRVILVCALNSPGEGNGNAGPAFAVDGTLIGLGDADGARSRVSQAATATGINLNAVTGLIVYSPGVTSSLTYTVRVINAWDATQTMYVNRGVDDSNNARRARGASTFALLEVSV